MATVDRTKPSPNGRAGVSSLDTIEEAGEIVIGNLTLDYDLLGRDHLDPATVARYEEAYRDGKVLPPVRVVDDGSDFFVWEGFHRTTAARKVNLNLLPVLVRKGTKRDALRLSLGANEEHGLARSPADRRLAVVRCLEDPEWSKWSLREIAKLCNVSYETVRTIRGSLFAPAKPPPALAPAPGIDDIDDPDKDLTHVIDEDDAPPDAAVSNLDSPDDGPALDEETEWLNDLKLTARLTAQPLLTFWEDAKKYRRLQKSDSFHAFDRTMAQVLAQRSVALSGPYHDALARFRRAVVFLHPDKWKLCADCGGSGLRGPGNCSGCKGRGYLVCL